MLLAKGPLGPQSRSMFVRMQSNKWLLGGLAVPSYTNELCRRAAECRFEKLYNLFSLPVSCGDLHICFHDEIVVDLSCMLTVGTSAQTEM